MPLKDTHLIDFKHDRVELIAELLRSEDDDPGILQSQIAQRIFDHQLELMTDPALLDQGELIAVSSFVSRETVAPAVVELLEMMGLNAIEQETANRSQNTNWIGRFVNKKQERTHLQKWSLNYQKAAQLNPKLGKLEAELDQYSFGPDRREMVQVFQETFANCLETHKLSVDLKGLKKLEQTLVRLRGNHGKPWILLPSTVQCITSFLAEVIRSQAIHTHWS